MIGSMMGAAVTSTTLRWDALPPLWVVVLVIIPIVALTVRFIYRREPGAMDARGGGRPLRMMLGGLRIMAVLLALGALFGPYAETIEGDVAKRTLVIAIDTSRSMSLSDRYQRNEKLADAIAETIHTDRSRIAKLSRLEIAKRLVAGDEKFLAELGETFDLQVFTFDRQAATSFLPAEQESTAEAIARLRLALKAAKPTGGVTRIGGAIQTLVRRLEARDEAVAGIFLLTDGRQTGGAPDPIIVARGAGEGGREGIPIFPVPIGDPAAAINVGVSRVDAPEVVFAGDRVTFTATVHARGCGGRDAMIEALVVDSEGRVLESLPIETEPFVLPADDAEPVKASFRYKFATKGTYDLKIGVAPLSGEAVISDNHRRHSIRVVELKMNVLFVADRPSYVYRFFGEAVRRAEKTVRAQTINLSADKDAPAMATRGLVPIREFPTTRAELAPYDVVILQDVKPGAGRFAPGGAEDAAETIGLIAEWVKAGGGLVLQSGREMNLISHYSNTELPALLPVVPGRMTQDARDALMGGTADEKWLHLTDAGLEHPIMRILEDGERVKEFWESELYATWYYAYTPVKHAKSSATVLAVRREESGTTAGREPHPMIALQEYGLGKVLWLAHEEFWRMRKGIQEGDPNLYYWRFWSGIIRHLATYRLLGGNKRIKIWVDRADGRYNLGDPDGPGGETRTIRLIEPDGNEREIVLTAERSDPPEGLFRSVRTFDRPGTYRLVATSPDDPEPAKATFVIEETTIEMRDPLVDMTTLQGIAKASRGRVLSPPQFRRLIEDKVVPPTSVVRSGEPKRTPLWDRAWVLWLFVGLLAAEWIIRRMNHML